MLPYGASSRFVATFRAYAFSAMLFKAYFDESGLGKQVFAFGGIVMAADEWNMFTDDWRKIVEPLGVVYHASDCENGFGAFTDEKGWPKDRRRELIISLVKTLRKREFFGVGVGCEVAEVEKAIRVSEEDLWRTLYAKCFQIAVATALQQTLIRDATATLSVMCDRQDQFEAAGRRSWKKLLASERLPSRDKLNPKLEFGARHKELPLQAGDFAAYETYKQIYNQLYDRQRPFRLSLYHVFEHFYSGLFLKEVFIRMLEWDSQTTS